MNVCDNTTGFENNLFRRFEEIHNYIYANDGLSSQQALNEFLKILFVKIVDERLHKHCFAINADEMQYNTDIIYEKILQLFQKVKIIYQDVFDVNESLNLSARTLAFVINKLQYINFTETSNDVSGLAFQKFLSNYEKESRGQFFTPQPIIDFCVNIINPHVDDVVIDPCCGSGGFLFSVLKYIKLKGIAFDKGAYILNKLYGVDINKDIAKIAKMKFILEANLSDNIFCENSLEDVDSLRLQFNRENYNKFEGFDILLTNPPFGTSGKITDPEILRKYDLGFKWKFNKDEYVRTNTLCNGQPAEILFLERCLELLKEGGKMGIVLPNGHFENPSLDYLRNYIKSKAKILAVINLPQETFVPYGTGVKTSLLFLQKQTISKESGYSIFFGKITKLGYQGNKNGTPTFKKDYKGNVIYNNGVPVVDEDFSDVVNDYTLFRDFGITDFKSLSYVINSDRLKERLDYDFYSPENHLILNEISNSSVRLGDIVDIVKVKSEKLKNKELCVEYIELSDINAFSLEIINTTNYRVYELPSRASYELKEDDIVTAVAGNSIGTEKHVSAIVTNRYEGCICTNGFRILRNPKIDKYYLLYYLRSEMFLKQVLMYRTGAAIPSLSDKDLANIMVYIPNEDLINSISSKVRMSLEMRKESSRILESISF